MNSDDIYRLLGEAVARRRKLSGMTQADLAKVVGLSRASIANIEVGRQKMLVHQAYALADALKLDHVGQLLPLPPKSEPAAEHVRVHMGVTDAPGGEVGLQSITARQRAEIESLVSNAQATRGRKAGSR
jgi:DNA-binding XRE family transcriptional regulator